MTYSPDTASDMAWVDGAERVTYSPRNPTATDTTNVLAKRGALSYRDMQMLSSIGLQPTDLVWRVLKSDLGSHVPRAGDFITDAAAVAFEVVSVLNRGTSGKYRLLGRERR